MKRRIGMFVWIGVCIAGLAACAGDGSEGAQVIHVEDGAEETLTAQTAWAQANPSPTPGPSPTASLTPTPYSIPATDPEADPDTVITSVGSTDLTLADFQKHVRFERWFRLYQLTKLVEKHGADKVLDLRNPDNELVGSLFETLADSYSFGAQVQRIMVIDEISLQEAIRRGLEVDPFLFDSKLAQYMNMTTGEGGQLPPEFDAEYKEFIKQMKVYTGMSEEEFRRIVRARTLYTQLQYLIGQDKEAVPADQEARVGLEVQDIMVATEAEAQEIVDRVRAGERLRDVAISLGYTPANNDESRVLRWSDENLTEEVMIAVFQAEVGSVVGPIATPQGFYVARIVREVYDVLSPQDIEALRKDYFLNWVEAKMDDADYVKDYDNWLDYTPQEPLPQDVSPLLRDENVILPEVTPSE